MGLDLEHSDGQTPLDEDEKEGLLIPTITTKGDLDEFEQLGIEKAIEWTTKRRFDAERVLTEDFVRELHRRMFSDIWKWAGEFRRSNKNIGVERQYIGTELRALLDDCRYWIANKTYDEDEIAIRFSHRMVKIHPFANGNGRHSRLIADILIQNVLGKSYFTWGSKNLKSMGEARTAYLAAIREADNHNYRPLIIFARS